MNSESILPGNAKSEEQHRLDICTVGRWMYEQGFNVACEGNLSVRLDPERILTTPTCMNKGMLSPDDLAVTNLDGRQLSGSRKMSSELGVHLLFYRMRPDVHAICHAHPPTATGFAVADCVQGQTVVLSSIVGQTCDHVVRCALAGMSSLIGAC